ncbi:MAG TPA: IclR family transcriptional regulator C-terminal domain-containing protein [Rhodanobacteraceae bacterium]|nr:IclR family transcriptional regulator C-terminal domain-containing protein [Rhodanobacteraceae bacterium]
MAAQRFEQGADYVQSLARGLQVLRAFDHDLATPTLSQVAQRTGLSRAVARRLLLTLQHLGYVSSSGRNFFLTPRVLELGYSYLASLELDELVQQSMERLSRRVHESCSMSVLDGRDIVYVLRVPVRRVISVALGVGARLPAFATSMGRVMLADLSPDALAAWMRGQKFRAFTPRTLHASAALKEELARVREQGYALVSRELESGLCSIAVPVHAATGRVVAALNVGMSYTDDAPERAVRKILPALREAQAAIEHTVAHRGWSLDAAMRYAHG